MGVGGGYLVSKPSPFLLLPPLQKRMSFLLSLLVPLVPGSPSEPSAQRWRKSNSWLLWEPLNLGFPLLPCRLSAGSMVKPFSLGWPWGFLPDPPKTSSALIQCYFTFLFSPGFRNRMNAAKLPSLRGHDFHDTVRLEVACCLVISLEVACVAHSQASTGRNSKHRRLRLRGEGGL